VDATRPQRKRMTEKHPEKRSGDGNVDSGLQIQLEEDGDGIARQSCGDNWSVACDPLGVTRHKCK